jgi:hypothetical protein
MATVRSRTFKLAAEHDVTNTLVCAGTGAPAGNQLGRPGFSGECACMYASIYACNALDKEK